MLVTLAVVPGGEAGAIGAGSAATATGLVDLERDGGSIATPTLVLVKKKRTRAAGRKKKKKKKAAPAAAAEHASAAVAAALSAPRRAGAAMPLDAVHEE